MRHGELVKRDAEQAGYLEAGAAGNADHRGGYPVLRAQVRDGSLRAGPHGNHGARG